MSTCHMSMTQAYKSELVVWNTKILGGKILAESTENVRRVRHKNEPSFFIIVVIINLCHISLLFPLKVLLFHHEYR